MPLGKKLGRPPREVAAVVAERLANDPTFGVVDVAGPGFINVKLDDAWLAGVLTEALRDQARDGVPPVDRPEKIVVDFSSPNIAKQMHVGHLRSTILGDAIVRTLRYVGHEVIGDNHLGDWGTQFGLLIAGMRHFGDEAALASDAILELERVYKLAADRAKDDHAFADEARAELKKLQTGDPENRALWETFVAATRRTLDRIYARLGVRFDEWLGESAYDAMLPGVVETLVARGFAREDDGAICVFFGELDGAPKELAGQKEPFIVRKKDGAFLYATTDIATVLHRRDALHADRAIYVVDHRQSLHFKQLFALAAMLGVTLTLEHVGFGTVLGTDGKPLKTRAGKLVTLASLLDEAVGRAEARIREGVEGGSLHLDPDEIPAVAEAVGIGAVKYADLHQNRLSDYQFDLDKMVTFQGDAGPYLQYAHARCVSIFKKGDVDPLSISKNATLSLEAPAEATLARRLIQLADVVHRAAETSQPHLICQHLFELARAFSQFYADCPVLGAEGSTRESRLALTALTARQLRRGLGLLGMTAIERM
jgi:arginyl-tRNA synthetase